MKPVIVIFTKKVVSEGRLAKIGQVFSDYYLLHIVSDRDEVNLLSVEKGIKLSKTLYKEITNYIKWGGNAKEV